MKTFFNTVILISIFVLWIDIQMVFIDLNVSYYSLETKKIDFYGFLYLIIVWIFFYISEYLKINIKSPTTVVFITSLIYILTMPVNLIYFYQIPFYMISGRLIGFYMYNKIYKL